MATPPPNLTPQELVQFYASGRTKNAAGSRDRKFDSLNPIGLVMDVLDTPGGIVRSGVKETSDLLRGEGFSPSDFARQFRDNYSGAELVQDVVGSTGNRWVDGALGFAADVALDPLTYVGAPGAAALARGGSKRIASEVGVDAVERAAQLATRRGNNIGDAALRRLDDAQRAVDNAGNDVARAQAQSNLNNTRRVVEKRLRDSGELAEVERGLFDLARPGGGAAAIRDTDLAETLIGAETAGLRLRPFWMGSGGKQIMSQERWSDLTKPIRELRGSVAGSKAFDVIGSRFYSPKTQALRKLVEQYGEDSPQTAAQAIRAKSLDDVAQRQVLAQRATFETEILRIRSSVGDSRQVRDALRTIIQTPNSELGARQAELKILRDAGVERDVFRARKLLSNIRDWATSAGIRVGDLGETYLPIRLLDKSADPTKQRGVKLTLEGEEIPIVAKYVAANPNAIRKDGTVKLGKGFDWATYVEQVEAIAKRQLGDDWVELYEKDPVQLLTRYLNEITGRVRIRQFQNILEQVGLGWWVKGHQDALNLDELVAKAGRKAAKIGDAARVLADLHEKETIIRSRISESGLGDPDLADLIREADRIASVRRRTVLEIELVARNLESSNNRELQVIANQINKIAKRTTERGRPLERMVERNRRLLNNAAGNAAPVDDVVDALDTRTFLGDMQQGAAQRAGRLSDEAVEGTTLRAQDAQRELAEVRKTRKQMERDFNKKLNPLRQRLESLTNRRKKLEAEIATLTERQAAASTIASARAKLTKLDESIASANQKIAEIQQAQATALRASERPSEQARELQQMLDEIDVEIENRSNDLLRAETDNVNEAKRLESSIQSTRSELEKVEADIATASQGGVSSAPTDIQGLPEGMVGSVYEAPDKPDFKTINRALKPSKREAENRPNLYQPMTVEGRSGTWYTDSFVVVNADALPPKAKVGFVTSDAQQPSMKSLLEGFEAARDELAVVGRITVTDEALTKDYPKGLVILRGADGTTLSVDPRKFAIFEAQGLTFKTDLSKSALAISVFRGDELVGAFMPIRTPRFTDAIQSAFSAGKSSARTRQQIAELVERRKQLTTQIRADEDELKFLTKQGGNVDWVRRDIDDLNRQREGLVRRLEAMGPPESTPRVDRNSARRVRTQERKIESATETRGLLTDELAQASKTLGRRNPATVDEMLSRALGRSDEVAAESAAVRKQRQQVSSARAKQRRKFEAIEDDAGALARVTADERSAARRTAQKSRVDLAKLQDEYDKLPNKNSAFAEQLGERIELYRTIQQLEAERDSLAAGLAASAREALEARYDILINSAAVEADLIRLNKTTSRIATKKGQIGKMEMQLAHQRRGIERAARDKQAIDMLIDQTGIKLREFRGMMMPEEISEALVAMTKFHEIGTFAKYFDQATQWWKGYATLSPGFHVRNAYSAIFMNWMAGVPAGTQRRFMGEYLRYAKGLPAKDTEVRESIEMLVNNGVIGQLAQYDEEVARVLNDNRTLNPFSGLVDRDKQFIAVAKSRDLGSHVEAAVRGALAFHTMKSMGGSSQNAKLAAAITAVDKFHFNYADLSQFERGVKRFIPFYTWMARNIPLQLEILGKNPQKVMAADRFLRNVTGGQPINPFTPDYYEENEYVQLTDTMFLTPELPTISFRREMNKFTEPLDFLSGSNALIKAPIEFATGRDFFRGFDLEGKERVLRPAESLIPILGRARRLLPVEDRYQERWLTSVASFLGVPVRELTQSEMIRSMINEQRSRPSRSELEQKRRDAARDRDNELELKRALARAGIGS